MEQWAGGKFDDIFEVRGFPRGKRGKVLAIEEEYGDDFSLTTLQYEGLDGYIRRSHIQRLYRAEKLRSSPNLVGSFTAIEVGAKATVLLKTVVSFDERKDCKLFGIPYATMTVADQMQRLSAATGITPFSSVMFETDNAILNRSILNAQTDIFMLLTHEPGNFL